MNKMLGNIMALAVVIFASGAIASPQTFAVVPAQPAAGESFQLVLPVESCGLKEIVGTLEPGTFDINVDIQYRFVFCTDEYREPIQVPVKVFRDNAVAKEGTYRVNISQRVVDDDSPTRKTGFGLVSVQRKEAKRPAAADSGSWMQDPGVIRAEDQVTLGELNSQRVHIEQRGDRIILNLNTFDVQGNPVWFQSEGVRKGNAFNGDLLKVVGRSPFDTTFLKKPEYTVDAGQVAIEFLSPARAVIWLSQRPEGSASLLTVPLVIVKQNKVGEARKAFEGRWVLTLENADESMSAMSSRILTLASFANNGVESYKDDVAMVALVCSGSGTTTQTVLTGEASPVALAPTCDLVRFGQFVDAQFNEIGWNRLRGVNSAGKPVSLLRISD